MKRNRTKKIITFLVISFILIISIKAYGQIKIKVLLPREWRSYTHVKSMVIPDRNHELYGFHHIYVNNKGLKALLSKDEFPQRTIFVAVFYDVEIGKDGSLNQGKKLYYLLMIKDARAEETGGWIYAFFDRDGKYIEKDVEKECYDCHLSAKDSDYVFSKFIK